LLTIDADAHVLETEKTWEYMEGADRKYRPRIVGAVDGADPNEEYWLVDGTLRLKSGNVGRNTPQSSREMRDIGARLRHMDELGVSIQVLYPTLFLIPLTPRPEVELAISRSYNRWMADIWSQAQERLRWTAVLPLLSMDKALAEAKFAKENGCCGIFMRGSEGDRLLSDPYFFPLYEEASRLDLPICIHAATGSSTLYDYYRYETVGFSKFKLVCVGAFHSLVMDRIPERFPKLKIGFLEISAEWLPYVYTDLAKRFRIKGKELKRDFLRQDRLYVACETTDDIPYIVEKLGEDNILIGSDYAHADSATELLAIDNLKSDPRLKPTLAGKIVSDNARALYGL
jgi:predicted TIM-barrel fold metal-dependent hydrolase